MKLGLMMTISKDNMKMDLRLVAVVVTLVVALVLIVRACQDKGEYHNDSSWAVAQERYLSK